VTPETREALKYPPKQNAYPDCGGKLNFLGEDISEILQYVPARFKVIRQVRPKLACAGCGRIVQAEAPSRPIERGVAGPGLLAHVLASKYCDHLPLYRQLEMSRGKALSWNPRRWGIVSALRKIVAVL
jgi:transposase